VKQSWNKLLKKEYTTWDHEIVDKWTAANDVTDVLPDAGREMFWVVYEVPSAGLSTAAVFDEVKVRGSDTDFITGTPFPVFWGHARVEKHRKIELSVVRSPAGTSTANVDIDSAHQQTVFDFNGAGDDVSFTWSLPEGIDTSHPIEVKLDYSSTAADTYEIDLSASTLPNNTAINSTTNPDYTSSTSIVADAANTFYIEQNLTSTGITIQDLAPNDVISFELERTDTTNSFFPFVINIHYSVWTTGEHT